MGWGGAFLGLRVQMDGLVSAAAGGGKGRYLGGVGAFEGLD